MLSIILNTDQFFLKSIALHLVCSLDLAVSILLEDCHWYIEFMFTLTTTCFWTMKLLRRAQSVRYLHVDPYSYKTFLYICKF